MSVEYSIAGGSPRNRWPPPLARWLRPTLYCSRAGIVLLNKSVPYFVRPLLSPPPLVGSHPPILHPPVCRLSRKGALLVFFFQFGVVPLLIWRPVDERTMPVVKFVASHRLGPGSGAGAALAEANLPPSSSSSSSSHEEEAWQSVSPSPSPR